MKAKTLDLRDALELASVLNNYIDDKSTENDGVLDFIEKIVSKIPPMEYLHCVKILTGESEEEIANLDYLTILTEFIDGLRNNKILTLISFYRSLGFK